jgi:cell division inhibitor SepF
MASMWRRTMLYLGLGNDEEYDDVSVGAGGPSVEDETDRYGSAVTPLHSEREVEREPAPRREPPPRAEPASGRQAGGRVSVRPVAPAEEAGVRPVSTPSPSCSVRTVPARGKPNIVNPRSFNDAQHIADRYKAGQIVIVNLQGADRDLARRLIDFCSGVCYGLTGQMEKVAHQVYLLSPRDAELSEEERRRLQEQGLHR